MLLLSGALVTYKVFGAFNTKVCFIPQDCFLCSLKLFIFSFYYLLFDPYCLILADSSSVFCGIVKETS